MSEENPEEKPRIQKIVYDEKLLVPQEYEKYRSILELKWEEDKKKTREKEREKEKAALIELNVQRVNGPPGDSWLFGHELIEKGIPEFQLFKLVYYRLLTPYDSNGEQVWPREMPDVDPSESTEEYSLDLKKAAIRSLLPCRYSISNLLEIPELAAIIKASSADENFPTEKVPSSETQATGITMAIVEESKNEEFVFRKSIDGWRMVFNGEDFGHLTDIGFAYIHYCMEPECEGKDISSIDLEKEVKTAIVKTTKMAERQFDNERQAEENEQKSSNKNKRVSTDDRAVLDKQAIMDYRKEQKRLEMDLEQLEDQDDTPERDILKKELQNNLEFIQKQLSTNVFKGKSKNFSDQVERIHDRVSAAIDRAINKLKDSPEAYEHFKRAFAPIHSSSHHYKPVKKINWVLN